MQRPTLRRRLYALLLQWFILFLVGAGVVTLYSLSRARREALEDRLLLARTVAHYLDSILDTTFRNLEQLPPQLPSLDEAARGRLRSFRFQCLFRDAVFILDETGRDIIADPPYAELPSGLGPLDREQVSALLADGTRPTLAIVQPFERGGKTFYLVGEMNPRGSQISAFLQGLEVGPDFHLVVVDREGMVIAGSDQSSLFRRVLPADTTEAHIAGQRPMILEDAECTICEEGAHGTGFLTVMVPLRFAPWAVVVQQSGRDAFGVLRTFELGLIGLGLLLLGMAVLLSRGLTKSVIEPIQALSRRAERFDQGDLTTPIRASGPHEIALLGHTLEAGRKRLSATLEELEALTESLESQVAERTRQLKLQLENLELLHDVSLVISRERQQERFVPEVLRVISRHLSFRTVALVVTAPDRSAQTYAYPEEATLPWLDEGESPPRGWQSADLIYRGARLGRLFYRSTANEHGQIIESLAHQLAVSLHGANLLERTLEQDAQRRELVRRLMGAGEEERRRIARELHDEISQLLAVIQLSLEEAGGDSPAMRKAKNLLTKTQKEIHRVIYDLRPSVLDDLGLSAAVEWYARNVLEPRGIQVHLEVEETPSLPAEHEITTFRIYQEIVTNILRHAEADSVSVELAATPERLTLAVEDDGVGFTPEEEHEGVGIVGMRERAALVHGSLTMDSEPGMGTLVHLEIPLPGEGGSCTP